MGSKSAEPTGPLEERGCHKDRSDAQVHESKATGQRTLGATGEVESRDPVERADIPQRGVQAFKEFARGRPRRPGPTPATG